MATIGELDMIYGGPENIPAKHWPFCTVPGCGNRCFTPDSHKFCFPHLEDSKTLDQYKEREREKVS